MPAVCAPARDEALFLAVCQKGSVCESVVILTVSPGPELSGRGTVYSFAVVHGFPGLPDITVPARSPSGCCPGPLGDEHRRHRSCRGGDRNGRRVAVLAYHRGETIRVPVGDGLNRHLKDNLRASQCKGPRNAAHDIDPVEFLACARTWGVFTVRPAERRVFHVAVHGITTTGGPCGSGAVGR